MDYKGNEKFLSFKNYGSITNKAEILIRDEKQIFLNKNKVMIEIDYLSEVDLPFKINIDNNLFRFEKNTKFLKKIKRLK